MQRSRIVFLTLAVAAILSAGRPAMAQGVISALAGTGFCNFSGDGGPALTATLCSAQSPAVDAAGNIYFYDQQRIRGINPNGVIATIAGNGMFGSSGDGGPALSASLGYVHQIAIYGHMMCFGDYTAYKIRCVDLNFNTIQGFGTGISGTGGDGGNITAASFSAPYGVAFDDVGNFYISDFVANSVRRVTPNGTITTIVGPGPGYCCLPLGDGGPALGANIYEPMGLAYRNGGLYIADMGNERIRRVDLTTGIINTVAGNGTPFDTGGNADGQSALQAGVVTSWLTVDPAGNLFFAGNGTIRMVDTSGIISTIAGTKGVSGSGNDDILATQTVFAGITGLGWDAIAKRLLIVDNGARVRQIFFTPPTTTILSSSSNPAVPGSQVVLQATVSPANATGVVRFYQDPVLLGSAPVVNGVATFLWTAPFGGYSSYSMRAVYGGDPNNNLSVSPTVYQTEQQGTTTTALASSVNPSTQGQSVTFTVTVTPAAATGTVYLLNGQMNLASGPLTNGVATFNISNLPVGSNAISAYYGNTPGYLSSVSPVVTQVVRGAATTTTLASTPNPSNYGDTVTLTATVSPNTATGPVQFFNGAALLGSGILANGQAQITVNNLPAGSNALTATYAGDTANAGSTSAAVTQTVGKAASTVTLTSSLNPSPVGQSVTFTATVSPSWATGTVTFLWGSGPLGTAPVNGGVATFTTSALTPGDNTIQAGYGGDANAAPSAYAVMTETISKTPTKIVIAGSPNPAIEGQTVTLTAVVTPSTATGLVQFFEGSGVLGSVPLAGGTAVLTLTPQTYAFSVGTHSITANYNGDANNALSTSAVLTETIVKKTATSVTLASSLNPSTYGQSVSFTAQVTPAAATGTVLFVDGSTGMGTATLAGGTATLTVSNLSQDVHSIFVVYNGDVNYATSTSTPITQTVSKIATHVTLTGSPNPATVGQTVTLVATVSPASATGIVQFFEGPAILGSPALNGGTATLVLTPQAYAFAAGTHSLTVNYNGDANYSVSTSPVLLEVVNKAPSAVSLASSLNPSVSGQNVTFTANVVPASATGSIQFLDGATVLGSKALAGGAASLSLATLAVGTHSVTAVYSGDGNLAAGSSPVLTQTVNAPLPGPPSHLTATAVSSSQINLSWTASPTAGVTYTVYVSGTRLATGISGTSYSDTGLPPSTTRSYTVTAQNAAGESTPSNQASATTSAALACKVNYTVTGQWNVGFGTSISIQNTGTVPINGWNLTWTWGANQQITQAWNSDYTQNGHNAKLTNASWNPNIAPGATVNGIGFNASYSGTNPTPTAFYLNGTLCH